MKRVKQIFLVAGIGLLGYAIHANGGPGPMIKALAGIGWWYPLAFVGTAVAHALRTTAWGIVVKNHTACPPLLTLARIRLIGESLNYLTMAGPILGDPAKATLLSSETGDKSLKTVMVDRYLYATASTVFFVAAGCAWFGRSGVPACLAIGITILVSPLWVGRYAPAMPRSTMYRVIGIHFLANTFMALEAAILLKGLGVNASLLHAVSVEAVNKGLNALFFFLPMQVGVTEGGNAALLHSFGMGAAAGLTLGLAMRVRALIWSSVGLVLLYDACKHDRRKAAALGIIRCHDTPSGVE